MNKDDERTIRELVQRWMAASKAGGLATVLDLMTDDAIFMVPGREPFGKDEFRAASEAMQDVEIDGRAEVLEISVHDDWAWLRNRIEITITSPSGAEPVHRAGYTLSVFRKCGDGRWRLARDANLVS